MSGKWISYQEVALRPLGESATYARRRQGQLAAVRAHVDEALGLSTPAGMRSSGAASVAPSSRSPSRANSPGTARRSQPCSTA